MSSERKKGRRRRLGLALVNHAWMSTSIRLVSLSRPSLPPPKASQPASPRAWCVHSFVKATKGVQQLSSALFVRSPYIWRLLRFLSLVVITTKLVRGIKLSLPPRFRSVHDDSRGGAHLTFPSSACEHLPRLALMASSEPIECQVPMFSPLLSLISFPGPDRVPVLVHVCRARNWSSSSACLIPVPAVQPLFLFSSSSSSFCLILLLLSDPSVTVCPVLIQVVALRVSIHCQGCKKKVKKVLQNISGTRRTLLASGSFSLPPTRRSLALSKALLTQLLAFDCSTYSALVHAFFFLQAIAGLVLVFFLIGKITKQSRWQVSGTV
jgi:hypothetical protein